MVRLDASKLVKDGTNLSDELLLFASNQSFGETSPRKNQGMHQMLFDGNKDLINPEEVEADHSRITQRSSACRKVRFSDSVTVYAIPRDAKTRSILLGKLAKASKKIKIIF